eukprot:TRINITY_DN17513_c0_g1_i2.p1 TRINITY_DN17513_c0_g1~~TRINITY_DN17513_c0_g1_i2.p1  ORF type:complete len:369 (+),score=60.67 TRINITY_DN17513_c0_g1_i2:31-1137(+)
MEPPDFYLYVAVDYEDGNGPQYAGESACVRMVGVVCVEDVEARLREMGKIGAVVMQYAEGWGWRRPGVVGELYKPEWFNYCVVKAPRPPPPPPPHHGKPRELVSMNVNRPILGDLPTEPAAKKRRTTDPVDRTLSRYQIQLLGEVTANDPGFQEGYIINADGKWDKRHPVTRQGDRLLDALDYPRTDIVSLEYLKIGDGIRGNTKYLKNVRIVVWGGRVELRVKNGVTQLLCNEWYALDDLASGFKVTQIDDSATSHLFRIATLDTTKAAREDLQSEPKYLKTSLIKELTPHAPALPAQPTITTVHPRFTSALGKLRVFREIPSGFCGFCKAPGIPEVFLAGTAESIIKNIDAIAAQYDQLMAERRAC